MGKRLLIPIAEIERIVELAHVQPFRRGKEINRRIGSALELLSPRERMVFELKHYQGLRLRAIGEVCGTSEETAKNCLFRATQKLRLSLADLV